MMLRYADTCLLLSLFFRDSGTEAALAWLQRAAAEPVLVSHWSLTEFASAAGILARRGELSVELHREGLARFRRFVAARLTTILPLAADFDRACAWMDDFRPNLRAGDALHLAICTRQGATLCTADQVLAQAASRHGVAVATIDPLIAAP